MRSSAVSFARAASPPRDVSEAQRQRGDGRCARFSSHGEDEAEQQEQGEQRPDGGHQVPRGALGREGPQQVRAVGGAGVEHAVGGVADDACRQNGAPFDAEFPESQPGQGGEGAADGNRGEGMRELAVELEVEQRVGVAVQEEVDVGQHAGGGADHPAGVAEAAAEHGFRGDGAEEAVGQRVHARLRPLAWR
jgi:hypothetical protein